MAPAIISASTGRKNCSTETRAMPPRASAHYQQVQPMMPVPTVR
jgi:hypothetical protein